MHLPIPIFCCCTEKYLSQVYYTIGENFSLQVSAKDSKLTETVKKTNNSKVTLSFYFYSKKIFSNFFLLCKL